MEQRRSIGMFSRVLPFIAFAVVVLFSMVIPFDTDLGWHLRYGEYFIDHLSVLRANELTYFLDTYTWSHSYTLYQLMTSVLFNIGGIKALIIGYSLVIGGIFYAFFRIMREQIHVAIVSFAVFSLLGLSTLSLGWRAQIFSVLFLLILFLVLRIINPVKRNVYLGVLFIVWVNVHGGFIVGLVIVGFDFVAKFWSGAKSDRIHLLIGFTTSIFATLLNPFGVYVYQEIIQHIWVPMATLIAEWVAPSVGARVGYTVFSIWWVCVLIRSHNSAKVFWVMATTLVWYLAFSARRNGVFVPLVFLVSLTEVYKNKITEFDKHEITRIAVWIILGVGFIAEIFQLTSFSARLSNWEMYCSKGLVRYPCEIVKYLKQNPLPDQTRVFTLFEWGGFFEWQLPEYQYFVDGRMPAWKTDDGVSPYTTYLEIIQAKEGYDEKLRNYNTQVIIMPSGTFLDLVLQKDPQGWKEVYRNSIDVIYVVSKD